MLLAIRELFIIRKYDRHIPHWFHDRVSHPSLYIFLEDNEPLLISTSHHWGFMSIHVVERRCNRKSSLLVALQMQRLQHRAGSNCPLGPAEKPQQRQRFESIEPRLPEDKAAHSCSRDLWKDPISHSLTVTTVTEGTSVPRRDELEALPVSTAGNTDVWVMNKALVEAIDAGPSCSARLFDNFP